MNNGKENHEGHRVAEGEGRRPQRGPREQPEGGSQAPDGAQDTEMPTWEANTTIFFSDFCIIWKQSLLSFLNELTDYTFQKQSIEESSHHCKHLRNMKWALKGIHAVIHSVFPTEGFLCMSILLVMYAFSFSDDDKRKYKDRAASLVAT